MNRPREYMRHQRDTHIARKKKIIHEQNDYWHYRHEGELNKGKIHCSCWMCRRKSAVTAKISDVRQAISDIADIEDAVGSDTRATHHICTRTKGNNRRSLKGVRRTPSVAD